jgi:hypothetical protein
MSLSCHVHPLLQVIEITNSALCLCGYRLDRQDAQLVQSGKKTWQKKEKKEKKTSSFSTKGTQISS